MALLTHLLRPGTRFGDTPCVILGQHYLSHRELGIMHRGDMTRVYLQELCAYDPVEAPVPVPQKYDAPGHADVAVWRVGFAPVAKVRTRKEGLIGSGQPFLEVALPGGGALEFSRHAERYEFTLPNLILNNPLAGQCTADFEGACGVECPATGLRAALKFRPGGAVKGEVRRLAGEGEVRVARVEGSWQGQILAYGLEAAAEGVLYDIADFPPVPPMPPAINLRNPGPQTAPRFWSAVLEAVLYADKEEAERAGRAAGELAAALPEALRGALMFAAAGDGATKPGQGPIHEEAEAKAAAADSRPLPPAVKLQRAQGRSLRYQLQYAVQAVSQAALEGEAEELAPGGGRVPA